MKAKDGKEFDNQSDCLKYEVDLIMSALLPRPNSYMFESGEGYIQQNSDIFDDVVNKITEILKEYTIINDYCALQPIRDAVDRFQCIDFKAREWFDTDKMYFHPNTPTLIIL